MNISYPIFPLPLVAFPGCRLPLQIFEPRYLDLVKHSLSQQTSFGIVTIDPKVIQTQADQPALRAIGTAVEIVDFSDRPNGMLGIVCQGLYKFELQKMSQSDAAVAKNNQSPRYDLSIAPNQLISAVVDPIAAESKLPVPECFEELVSVLVSLLEHPHVVSMGYHPAEDEAAIDGWRADASKLGMALAYLLPFPLEERYQLLATSDPIHRLGSIQTLMDRISSGG